MKKVEHLTHIYPDHDCEDSNCEGSCPQCNGCVYAAYGIVGKEIGTYQFCLKDECDFGEIHPDPEIEPGGRKPGVGGI